MLFDQRFFRACLPGLFAVSFAGLLVIGLAACRVPLEPVPQQVYVTAPENIRQQHDLITGQQVLNLVPQAEMDRRAQYNLDERLALYARLGLDQITDPASPQLSRLLKIARKVHRNSHLADRDITFVLINNNIFQAYTFGGRAVVFYTGLVDMLDDDQLAAVVGHELAHIAAGHIAEESSRSIVNTTAPETLAPLAGFYTISAEMEADRVGLVYAMLAGYDPRAGAAFWARQAKGEHSQLFSLFHDSHPPHKDRARYLEQDAKQLLQSPPGRDRASRDAYLRCNPLYCLGEAVSP